jgi:S-adenosylmethionine:tRNA ribosyltransferase-isomerase
VRTSDFDYHLPEEFIAQRPAVPRDSSRLLVLNRLTGDIMPHHFHDLPRFLNPKDALILNETKVIPARLPAKKVPTGGGVELLLLKRLSPKTWEALVGGRGVREGVKLALEDGYEAIILEDLGDVRRVVQFSRKITPSLESMGEMPLPPYIHTPLQNRDEYQTVFARDPGSAAAPTAGLHFTPQLLGDIERLGVKTAKVTLHVGLDTFSPVRVEDPTEHTIHSEWCRISYDAVRTINAAHSSGGRIIAVGTTTVRMLETANKNASAGNRVSTYEGPTDLFILPGFEFRAVDALITNFHLPRSTLLMMVCAFSDRAKVLNAYREAMKEGYRFYSFGDAMLIS